MAKGLSAAKAKKILQDGYVKGKPLTAKQKKYFGAIASGATPLKAIDGDGVDKAQWGKILKWGKDMYQGSKKLKKVDNFEFKSLPTIEKKQFMKVVDGEFDTIDYDHLIPTTQEISDLATKTRSRLMSDKFIKNNMEATGRSKDEVVSYVDDYIKEFENSTLAFDKTPDGAAGLYNRGKITIDPRKPHLTKENVLGTLEHEIEHMFSNVGQQGSDLYRHPKFKLVDRTGMPDENLVQNMGQPFEQQVRFRKALGWLEKNAGLKVGDNVTDEQVEALTDAIANWSKEQGKDFRGSGANFDIQHLFSSLDAEQFLKPGQYLMPNAPRTANLKNSNVRQGIKDILNKTYAAAAVGGLGAASQMGPKQEDGQFKNGGWLDKFAMGGSLPGASGMMYSRNSGSSAMSPPNLTKAQDGTVEYGTPEYKKAYEEGTFADVPNQLDEVVMYSGVDYEKYPYYNDLSAEQRKYFKDDGPIGRGVRRAAYTKRGLAEDTYDVVNPLMYGMLGLAGGMMAAPSIATLGRAAAVPIGRALSYKPFGGPVSIGRTIDVGSAAYAAYNTPEAYDKFKENPSFDTGLDLGLTAMDMIPYSEIFTGGKNIKNLYNKGKNLVTKTPTPDISNAIDASIDPGIKSNLIRFGQDVMDTPKAQIRASETFNKDWFNNPEIIRRTEEMLNQPSTLRSGMSETEILQDINMYNTMLDKTPNLPANLQAKIKDNLKDLNAGLAKRNLETVQQKGRFTEVFDENNLSHQEMALHYDENPRTLGLYKGSTNQASVNLERIKEKARDVGSVITHEDLHAITAGKSGYTDEAKDILNSAVGKDQEWWLNKINTTKDQKKRGELIDQLEYLARPQEIHARVHELRKAFNLKPGQEVNPSKIEAIMTKGLKGETPVDEGFFRLLGDKENFRKIFNKLPAYIPAAVGLGAASQNKNGGDVEKAQWGKLLKLAKKYGNKLFDFSKPAAKVDNTPSLKYTGDVDMDMDVFNAKAKVANDTRKEYKKVQKNIKDGEAWKYETDALEKLEAKSKFLDETIHFPFSDNSSDVYTNLTRYNLSDYLKKGLDKRFGTIGNDYTTGYGHRALEYKTNYLNDYFKNYRVGLPDGSTVPYGKLDGSVEIDPSSFNSSDEVMEELRRLAQTRMGDQFDNAFEKTSRIDFGDLLKNKNRNGGWLSKYENGGVIEDDRGQWAHPGEVTKINSNNITMKGVNYPVLGISDTGDKKMMQPGKDYKFNGNSVTEYPMAQDGLKTKVPDPTPQINFMKDWASSAMHNKMLDASSSSDKFKNKVKGARTNFDDVTIGMFDDPGYLGLYSNSNIRMNPSLLEEAPIGNGYNSILTHELSHYTDDVNPSSSYFKGYNIPLSDQKLIKDYSKKGIKRAKAEEKELNKLLKSENMKPNSKDVIKERVKRLKYLGSPTETRSRINATRYFYENDKNFGRSSERNAEKNLPSIFDSEVTPDMIKVMQESGQYKQLQELYNDDQILEMFNTISDNSKSSDPSNMAYAKEGESLVALDQLTNFTNYNTPQPGGWLDKY